MKLVFMGTADLSCPSLQKLADNPATRIAAVVTQPDRPKGRDLKLQPSPVKSLAQRLDLPVLQPARARDEQLRDALRQLQPDLVVVVAFGQILPQAILDLPKFGCLNVHTSLLPKYRGASPIQSAILHGETETGVTIMKMDAGLDTGDILAQARAPILPEDNSQTLHDRLAELGADLLAKTIPDFVAGNIIPRPQPAEGATYAAKIRKEDGHIHWTEPALKILNRLRAFTPWPGAFTFLKRDEKSLMLKIWKAEPVDRFGTAGTVLSADKSGIIVACGENSLRILELQLEGRRRMAAAEFLAGHALRGGDTLG